MEYDSNKAEEIADKFFEALDECIDKNHMKEFLVAIAYVSGRSVGELSMLKDLGGLASVQSNFATNYNAGVMEAYGTAVPAAEAPRDKRSSDGLGGMDLFSPKRYLGVIN